MTTSRAPRAAPRSAAVVSEPERPRVVVSPEGARPMKPVTTGTTPASRSRPIALLARGSVFLRSHVAEPCRSSVARNVRASTARAGTPRAERAAATSGAESLSPKEATRSVTRGRPLAQERDPGERRVELREGRGVEGDGGARLGRDAGRRGLVPGAQLGDAPAGRAEAAPLRVVRGGEEEVGHAPHRRDDGDDPPAPRGGGEEAGGADDPGGVAERRPPELVDDERAFTHSRRGALSPARRAPAGAPASAPSGRRRGRC